MKKIGILCFASKKEGGIYQYTQSMVDALLLDKTNRYIIITSKNNTDYDNKDVDLIKDNTNIDNPFLKISTFWVSILGFKSLFSRKKRKLYESFDLLVLPVISLYPVCWINIPYIITIHDLQEKYFPQYFTLSQKIYRAFSRKISALQSSHIICESNYVKNDIIKYLKVQPSKISVIQSPPLLASNHGDNNEKYLKEIKNRYLLPERYILYPAQFWHHKNHMKLLEAFSILTQKYSDMHLVFTGGDISARHEVFKSHNGSAVMEKVKKLNCSQNIHFLGYVDYTDLSGVYILSEMLVVPTLFESVSLPIYEAFYLGVPVCASNVVALPEQVGNAGLLFNPYNPQDMADKMIEILENRDLKQRCIENGMKRIQELNTDSYSKSLVNIINEYTN
ncbi:MAG: glycosyltransferase family 4 protein [Sedimentisphaerales bacterium]|nr:glycosyltransferase family 4 protein [Sedimentisphaerales bacterium]